MPAPAKLKLLWTLPAHGGSRLPGSATDGRSFDLGYLTQIAQAADRLNFHGILVAQDHDAQSGLTLASALIPITRNLRFLVPVQPGRMAPGLAARMTRTLDRASGGRLLVHAPKPETEDGFLQAYKALLAGGYDRHGGHVHIGTDRSQPQMHYDAPDNKTDLPGLRSGDTLLFRGGQPDGIAPRLARLHERAAGRGQNIGFGIHLRVGAGRVASDPDALTGDPATIAARIDSYRRIGIDTLILSGRPELEEICRFGEQVLPLLPLDSAPPVFRSPVHPGPLGETVANLQLSAARPKLKANGG